MTNQEALERIEALLRARKDKDPNPKARVAWEAITVRVPALAFSPMEREPHAIFNWPEGAVLGLLEHDICDTLDWEADYWLLAPGVWQARIMEALGSLWHTGATRNEALAQAIISALEATETPLQAKRHLLALPIEERRKALRKQAEDLMREKPDYGGEE